MTFMRSGTRAALFSIPGLFCLIGVGLLAVALWLGYRSWAFLHTATTAPGTVIALEYNEDADSSGARPLVRYDLRGDPREIKGDVWSSPPAYAVGDQVRVLLPPGQPGAARIYSWFSFWFVPALLGGIGLVFALVGGGIGYLMWRA
jgi:hypothetical protein